MTNATQGKTEVKYFITPVGRLSYIKVWQPRKKRPGEEQKANVWDATFIIDLPKDMDEADKKRYADLKALVDNTRKAKWPNGKAPINSPFRYGFVPKQVDPAYNPSKGYDLDKNPEYKDKIVIHAVSYNRPPQVLRADKTEMMNQSELYSGCYARLWVSAFTYENSGNKGVSFSLQGLLKIRDGEPLAANRRAEDAFKEIQVDAAELEVSEADLDELGDIQSSNGVPRYLAHAGSVSKKNQHLFNLVQSRVRFQPSPAFLGEYKWCNLTLGVSWLM